MRPSALRGTQRRSEALRCTPRHSGALGSGAITCGIFARSSYLSRSLTTSFFAVRRERLTICRSASLRQIRYNQMQSDAIRCHQRQAEASTCFSASMLLGSVTRSFSSVRSRLWDQLMRRIRRQAELISEAQSALVPTDAPGHKCRALRHVRRLNHVSQPSHPKSCCNHVQSRAITCNHVQSRAITCNHVQSHAITCNHVQSRTQSPRRPPSCQRSQSCRQCQRSHSPR